MEKFKTLIGLFVKVYTNSHVVEGALEHLDEEKIIINSYGAYLLIYKNKIDMVLLNPNEVQEPSFLPEAEEPPPPQIEPEIERFAHNGIAENNQYGSILPATLLTQQPKDPLEALLNGEFFSDEPDLSITASTLYNEEGLLARAERQKIIEEYKKDDDGSNE